MMDCQAGVRVRCSHAALTNLRPTKARRVLLGARRNPCYIAHVGVAACVRSNTWILSINSAYPIQQENSVFTRSLRSSVSQAQPSAGVRVYASSGTRENRGNKPSFAAGNTLRASQSYPLLACGGDRQVKLQTRPKRNRQVYAWIKLHPPKRSAWLRQRENFSARNRGSQVSCALAQAFTISV